jgi:hypothetical protein
MMKIKLASNIALHVVVGLGCFVFFWFISYAAYERNTWWQPFAAGLGCAITAFAISFFGCKVICSNCPKSVTSAAFSIGFILVTLVSMFSLFDGNGQWKVSAFWLPITMVIFGCSYWGSTVGSRVKPRPIQ